MEKTSGAAWMLHAGRGIRRGAAMEVGSRVILDCPGASLNGKHATVIEVDGGYFYLDVDGIGTHYQTLGTPIRAKPEFLMLQG